MTPKKDYYTLLADIHRWRDVRAYVEVGVRHGASWRFVAEDSVSVGIDPAPNIEHEPPGNAQLFQGTSDDFFKTCDLHKLLGASVDLAFIDGMHLFEYALRDFINIERHCSDQSVICIHDCLPVDAETSTRERHTAFWTGDVFKIILCLKKYRPDLHIQTVDVPPTGLAIITNLDPKSTVLAERYDDLVQEFMPLAYDFLGNTEQKRLILNVVEDNRSQIQQRVVKAGFLQNDSRKNRHEKHVVRLDAPKKGLRKLGVLLCYNDADVLPDSIESLLANGHQLVVWDHGSTDETAQILDSYTDSIVERKFIPRSVDFYGLYEAMAANLIKNHIGHYDWISWPDQDEILEGPDRRMSYADHVDAIYAQGDDWIQFDNYNFWFTQADDPTIVRPAQRIRHYALFPDCSPRIRAWRARCTNIRHSNGNSLPGRKVATNFALRHYPMRSQEQMLRRLHHDRFKLRKGHENYHYENMLGWIDRLQINPQQLFYDDGKAPLCQDPIFNWRHVYGHGPQLSPTPADVQRQAQVTPS